MLINFIIQMVATLASGSSLSWLPCPLMYHHQCRFFFLSFFEHLLTSGATNVLGSSCVFLAPNLDSVIFP